ncbi:LPXTG cell wall anchor domain-containing protein, partial [Anaerotruncus massiliensis (ex Liu et al. 2021)]
TAPVAGYTLHRDGWLHLGWSTEPDGGIVYNSRYGKDMVPMTEDTTLYAVWVSPLRVRYETGLPEDDPDQARLEALLPTDEGSYRYAGSTDPAYPSEIEVKAPEEPFTRDGYYFGGWKYYWVKPYDVEVLPGETIDMQNYNSDEPTLVLRAVWWAEADVRLIRYDANLPEGETLTGKLPPNFWIPITRTVSYDPPDEPIPTCEGYLFAGWDVVVKKYGTTRATMFWIEGLGFASTSYAYFYSGTDYVIRARWVKPEEMRTMTVRYLDEDGGVHMEPDGTACVADYRVPEGAEILVRELPTFSAYEQDPPLDVTYYDPDGDEIRWSIPVDEDLTITMRTFSWIPDPDFPVFFQAGAYGSLRPADGGPLVRTISGGAEEHQPLAQTLDIGIPEPVPDEGYHFVGWNVRVEVYYSGGGGGRSALALDLPESHFANEQIHFYSNVDPESFVPTANRYTSGHVWRVTCIAMFAHDAPTPERPDKPAGGNGGGGGSDPKPPKRLLKSLEDPKPLETVLIEEKPIPLTGDRSMSGLALLALAVSGCGILLSRRKRR